MKTIFLLLLSLTLNFIAYGKGGDNDDNHNNYPTLVINGVEWAAVNVDDYRTFAARPDMYTKFYQWNRAKAWPAFDEVVAGFPAGPITDTVWTINPCPEGWRLPTADEGLALFEKTDNSWASAGKRGNAVVGRFFGPAHAECSLPDNMAGCIFLPAVGFLSYEDGTLNFQGLSAYYWLSTQYPDDTRRGYSLYFGHNTSFPPDYFSKAIGFSIRCVKDGN